MNRIDATFNNLKNQNRKAVIPFVVNGDPSVEDTVEIVLNLEKSGANIVEIGVPFSDPLADGKVIQNAYARALRGNGNGKGVKVRDVFTCGKKIREKSEIPLIIMIYYNLIYHYGVENFIKDAREAGFDGLIVPDIPLEERSELKEKCEYMGIFLIPLVAPTSKERILEITKNAKGFVYCVSSNGTTGERAKLSSNIKDYLEDIRNNTEVPICLGFGISSKEIVQEVKDYCDGVIVGSAVVRRLSENRQDAYDFIKELSQG